MLADQIKGKQGLYNITLSAPVQQWYYLFDRLLRLPVYYEVGLVKLQGL